MASTPPQTPAFARPSTYREVPCRNAAWRGVVPWDHRLDDGHRIGGPWSADRDGQALFCGCVTGGCGMMLCLGEMLFLGRPERVPHSSRPTHHRRGKEVDAPSPRPVRIVRSMRGSIRC